MCMQSYDVNVHFRGAELIEASTVKAVRARLEVEKTSMDLLKRQ